MKEDKPVLLLFHGSDWCPPCMKMQKEVFDDNDFIDFTSQRILFLDVDFPVKNKLSEPQLKHNNDLKKKFGIEKEFSQGYPQVVIIDASGNVLYQEKGYSGEGTKKLIDKITLIVTK
jgi:thioredoxin-related protein